jgi:hypothetical protein
MANTVARRVLSTEVNSLDRVQTRMAKASPSESMPVHEAPSLWTEAIRDGLIEACGSLKAAAITMEMDASQLSRDLPSGAFQLKRLEKLNAQEKAIVVKRLSAAFLEMLDPRDYALESLDKIEREVKELRQYVLERAS